MHFHDSTESTWAEGIAPAIEGCYFRPVRIDKEDFLGKICDEIIAEIRQSRFLVADFTGQRGGVYYEAGFAHGLGIPVIFVVRKNEVGKLHFDTRQFNHIVYETPEELKERLTQRIRALGL